MQTECTDLCQAMALSMHLDGSVKALQALPGDAIVSQVSPVAAVVSIALQELDVSLTYDDIIRRGVVVQLLMPVLRR